MTKTTSIALLFFLVNFALCDIYMHNPRGSNNRNCERNANRNNANRLFDSENNDAGGYACPRAVGGPETKTDKMYYYVGSKLPIEWTAQHGCGGNPRVRCEIVLQYMCGANVRDGTPKDARDAATERIPDTPEAEKDTRYGLHEDRDFYGKCKTRSRNLGLWIADRKINGKSARFTRQNNDGQRFGFECGEESQYYPYWHPSPWKDIAVLTDDLTRCNYYKAESQNVKNKGECIYQNGPQLGTGARATSWYNNPTECTSVDKSRRDSDKDKVQKWVESGSFGIPAPDCQKAEYTRSNHVGNSGSIESSRYWWNVPDDVNENCVLRLRYNITSSDVDFNTNSTFNGQASMLKQDPYVSLESANTKTFLSLAINTNQVSRTFQDRSYVFAIRARPAAIPSTAVVYNLNVRGKRGNIVQTFPSVEYDFVPNELNLNVNDYVHFQWTGSDYNPRRGCNNGEGGPPDKLDNDPKINPRADRSNLVEQSVLTSLYPKQASELSVIANSMFSSFDEIKRMAFINQDESKCLTMTELNAIKNQNEREYNVRNCAKLNAAATPYFDGGAIKLTKRGRFLYMSTRNNNFSNRDQKGFINVGVTGRPDPYATGTSQVPQDLSPDEQPDLDANPEDPNAVPTVDPTIANDIVGDGQVTGCGNSGSMVTVSSVVLMISLLASLICLF